MTNDKNNSISREICTCTPTEPENILCLNLQNDRASLTTLLEMVNASSLYSFMSEKEKGFIYTSMSYTSKSIIGDHCRRACMIFPSYKNILGILRFYRGYKRNLTGKLVKF